MKLVELYRFIVDNGYDKSFRNCEYDEDDYSSKFILGEYRFSENENINNPKLVQKQVRVKDVYIHYDNIEIILTDGAVFNFVIKLTRNDQVIAEILL